MAAKALGGDFVHLLPLKSRLLKQFWLLQAGQCGRCRADLGQAGRVCWHCRLDELLMAWELRLFSLQAHAVNKRDSVTAEDALRQVSASSLAAIPVSSTLATSESGLLARDSA